MLKGCRLIALPLFLGALSCTAPVQAEPRLPNQLPKYEYTRIDSFEVKGRQGVASDGNFYYVSGSKALYKYDKSGKLIQSNETPFEGYPIAANHIGGIDVFNGEVFVSAENFMDGVGKDIQIDRSPAAAAQPRRHHHHRLHRHGQRRTPRRGARRVQQGVGA